MTKKILLTLSLLIISVMTMSALKPADFAGKWVSDEVSMSNDPAMPIKACYSFNFNANGGAGASLGMTINVSAGKQSIKYNVYLTGTGKFTVDGNTLTVTLDKRSIRGECPLSEIRVNGEGEFTPEKVQVMMDQNLGSMMEMLQEPNVFQNVTLNGSGFTATQDGATFTFKKQK